jgi:hypothetical protein
MGQLLIDALVIKNATTQGSNTATRVGGWMEDAATVIEESPSALAYIDNSGQTGTLTQNEWVRIGAGGTLLFQRNGIVLIDADAGIIEYNGANKWFRFSFIVSLTVQSSRRIQIALFKNEQLVSGSESEQSSGSQNEITIPSQYVLEAENDDLFEFYFRCTNGNSTYQVDNLNVIINEF